MQTQFQKNYFDYLSNRRSVTKNFLGAPGPSGSEIEQMLTIASRIPDHGKLSPWRFIIYPSATGSKIGDFLAKRALERNPDVGPEVLEYERKRFTQAPLAIGIVSCPVEHNVPKWEQQLTSGVACYNLLQAAYSLGYAGQWLTDWFTFDAVATRYLGVKDEEQMAGFVFIGTPNTQLPDRPRPDVATLTTTWSAP